MSIARTVKSNFNIDRMATAAISLGFTVDRDAVAYGYYTGHGTGLQTNKKFPLVIRGKSGRFDIGVTEEGLCTDMHGGHCQQMLNQVLPQYYSDAAVDSGFQVINQEETSEELILTITR